MLPSLALTAESAAVLLWVLLGAFAARVLGQLVASVVAPRWLPPMEAWFSGVIEYPILLAIQVLFIVAMAVVAIGVGAGWAPFATRNAAVGNVLLALAAVYALVMVVRYIVRMARRPDQRWLGGTIPIAFHFVLAAWLFVLGSYEVS